MALSKVTYVDNQTIIGATNLNAIQDEVIANASSIANKQEKLVNKTNIKSINGESILGSGDLTVTATVTVDSTVTEGSTNPVSGGAVYTAIQSGGSGSGTVKYVTTSSTITEILEAIGSGYDVKLKNGTTIYDLSMYSETGRYAAFRGSINSTDSSGNKKVTCSQYMFTESGATPSTSDLYANATKVIPAGGTPLVTLSAGTNIDISDDGVISASGGSSSGSTIILNGEEKAIASFYAPTGAGDTDQYLKSNGSGAPEWADMPESGTAVYINGNTSQSTTARVYTPTTAGTSGQYLKSMGSGNAPVWAAVPSSGGSSITLNGTEVTEAAFYAPVISGTAGQYLKSNGSGSAPTWATLSTGTSLKLNGASSAASSASIYAPTSNGTAGQYLKASSSGAPTWATLPSTGTVVKLNGSSTAATSATIYTPTSAGSDGQYLKYSTSAGAPVWANGPDTNPIYVSVADYIETYGETINAINAAIADCPEHGTVYIPNLGSGHPYTGSNYVSITKAMTLLGDFYGFNFDTTDTLIEYTGTDYAIKGSCAGICLKNIRIHTANGGGVWIGDSSVQCYDTSVENVTCLIDNHTNAGFVFTHGFKSLFRNCYTNGGIIGFYFTGTTPTDAPTNLTSITVENCWACNYMNYGYEADNVYYSSFINCAADNAGLLVPTESDPRRVFKEGYGVCAYMINGCYGLSLVNCGCEFTASEACRIYDSNEIGITVCAYATNQASGTTVDSSKSVFDVVRSTVMFSNTRPHETSEQPKRWTYDVRVTSVSKMLFYNCPAITSVLKGTTASTIDGFSAAVIF